VAIKGKRKGRSRPRTVASAPRPFLVAPRTPPLRRRPVQVFLILLVIGAFVALGAGLRASQDSQQRRDEVQQFTSQVDALVANSGVVQPLGPTPIVLPGIGSSIAELRKKEPKDVESIADQARSWATAASNTADDIGAIQVDDAALKESRELMQQGLEVYASIARQLVVASRLEVEPRVQVLDALEEQTGAAAVVFDFGWGKLTTAQAEAGIQVQPLAPPGGLPGGGFPGGGFPAP
jgi:hypothetical protein